MTQNNKLRRLVLAATLPFVGVVAAFGVAPHTTTDTLVVEKVVEHVSLPQVEAGAIQDDAYWHEGRIQRGDTVASVLSRLHVDDAEAMRALRGNRDARALYQLVPGKSIRAK